MGLTVKTLSKKKINKKSIFPTRFVNEVCEEMHVHYKNLRLILSMKDWVELAQGFKDSLHRWKKRGCPNPSKGSHIELCRKKIVNDNELDTIQVNLNQNLYRLKQDMIFGEGANFDDPMYIHLKIRDIRIELSLEDFGALSDAIREAKEGLDSSSNASDIQA